MEVYHFVLGLNKNRRSSLDMILNSGYRNCSTLQILMLRLISSILFICSTRKKRSSIIYYNEPPVQPPRLKCMTDCF